MRYAAYMRTSTDDLSIDTQRRTIEAWVAARDEALVRVYVDAGRSGQGVARSALQRLLQDARQDAFDALVVHRLDRLGRNQAEVRAIQARLGNTKIFVVDP